jgi:N-acetylglucosamine kinase-like BadF-type ATPase
LAETYAGLCGGGTYTVCSVCDADEVQIGTGVSGPSNLNFVDIDQARGNVAAAVETAFRNAGVQRCTAGGVAAAGAWFSGGTALDLGKTELELRCEAVRSYGEHQAALAACGVFEDEGVAVVAGTGSSAVAYHRGEHLAVGGWGSILGDEGGAYDIAMNAVRAATRSFEESGPKCAVLEERVLAHFDLHAIRDLVPLFYREGVSRDKVGMLCEALAADQDEPVIGELFLEAGQELARLGVMAARRMFGREEQFIVAMSGGVWRAEGILVATFQQTVRSEFPAAELRRERVSPALGLAIRAKRDMEG